MPKNLLLVDDNPASSHQLVEMLREQGYAVKAIYDRNSVLSALRHESFDAVLTRQLLRGDERAGFDVAARVRASGNIPVIMMGEISSETMRCAVEKRLKQIGGAICFLDQTSASLASDILAAISVPRGTAASAFRS